MTEEPKTLRELSVKPGDVVRLCDAATDRSPEWPPRNYTIQPCGGIIDADGDMWGGSSTDFPLYPPYRRFTIVSRAADDAPNAAPIKRTIWTALRAALTRLRRRAPARPDASAHAAAEYDRLHAGLGTHDDTAKKGQRDE